MIRKLIWLILIFFLATSSGYGLLVWRNNQTVKPPGSQPINNALENSIRWLEQHREIVLKDDNVILWRMIQQAAEVSGDVRLQTLFDEFEQSFQKDYPNNFWRPLFHPGTWVGVRFEDIASFPYYNLHFIYAILCDNDLEQVPEIAEQNDPAFCDQHLLRPACATHQMMGIRLLQRIECGDTETLNSTVEQLQQRIQNQLIWDPRVVDVYMQRVLMLVESGGKDLVKPVWLQQLLEAQQADGGWSPFQPIFPFSSGRTLVFSAKIVEIKQPRSTFHMTAQGILLLSLLN